MEAPAGCDGAVTSYAELRFRGGEGWGVWGGVTGVGGGGLGGNRVIVWA